MGFEIQIDGETPTETPTFALPKEELTQGDLGFKSNDENITMGARPSRHLKESTRKLLGSQSTAAVVAERMTPPAPVVDTPSAASPADPAVEPPKPPPEPAKPAEVHADTVRANRLAEHNARLVAENETLKKAPPSGPSEREKAFDELENLIVHDPVAAHRKMLSMAMGVPADSKELDRFEQFLESELTSKRIGVPLNEDSEASRKAARTLVAVQREMRARKADEAPKPSPPVESDGEAVSFIGNRVAALKHAEKYPLLHGWGEHVDGQPPQRLILNLMRHGVDIGEFDRNEPIDDLIDKTSQRLESYYQAKADKLPKRSTAPAVEDGKNADPTGQKVGTISNATASVAPATLPATPKPQTYHSERERRIAIIRKRSVNGGTP